MDPDTGETELLTTFELIVEGRCGLLHLRPEPSDLAIYREIFLDQPHRLKLDRPPRVILDGGANIGASAVDFALRYPEASIIAIEPEERNFRLLVKNAEPFPNIFPVRAALWHEDAELAVLDVGKGACAFQTIEKRPGDGRILHTVPAVTVDSVMEKFGFSSIDILKLDIEGSEVEVLESSAPWIDRVEILIIELHEKIRPNCRSSFEIATKDFDHEPTSGHKIICRRKVATAV